MTRRLCWAVIVAALTSIALPIGASAAAAFGDNGVVVIDLPGDDIGTHVATTRDGKSVIAGSVGHRVAVVRLSADGKRDATFGHSGVRMIALGDSAFPVGLATGPSSEVIVATSMYAPSVRAGDVAYDGGTVAITKLRTDGSTDRSFGRNGVAMTDPREVRPLIDGGIEMVVARDGSILVLGATGAGAGYFGGAFAMYLARFTPDGVRDTSFGIGGVAATFGTYPPIVPIALDVQRDGSVIVAGSTLVSGEQVITRVTPSGLPDLRFGVGGVAGFHRDAAPSFDSLSDIDVQRDDAIVAFGSRWATSATVAAVVRLTANGMPDERFGNRGEATAPITEGIEFVAAGEVAPDGVIDAAAYRLDSTGWSTELIRLSPNGRITARTGTPIGPANDIAHIGERVLLTGNRYADRYTDGIVAAAIDRPPH